MRVVAVLGALAAVTIAGVYVSTNPHAWWRGASEAHSPQWNWATWERERVCNLPPAPSSPVQERSGGFVRPAAREVPLQWASSRRTAEPQEAPGSPESATPRENPTEVQLLQEFLPAECKRPQEPCQLKQQATQKPSQASHCQPQATETPAPGPLAEDPAQVILSLTDQFRNSVLRGTVFDPQGDPQKIAELKQHIVSLVRKFQTGSKPEGSAPAEAPEHQACSQACCEHGTPEEEPQAVAAAVEALRHCARELSQLAEELEEHRAYELADVLWETAHQLRMRARQLVPPP